MERAIEAIYCHCLAIGCQCYTGILDLTSSILYQAGVALPNAGPSFGLRNMLQVVELIAKRWDFYIWEGPRSSCYYLRGVSTKSVDMPQQ
jgi:hypothetical protein